MLLNVILRGETSIGDKTGLIRPSLRTRTDGDEHKNGECDGLSPVDGPQMVSARENPVEMGKNDHNFMQRTNLEASSVSEWIIEPTLSGDTRELFGHAAPHRQVRHRTQEC